MFTEMGPSHGNPDSNRRDINLIIKVPSIGLYGNFTIQDSAVDAQFFAMPLTQQLDLYFINNKKFGIPIIGAYNY
jgi:hypothetical protein